MASLKWFVANEVSIIDEIVKSRIPFSLVEPVLRDTLRGTDALYLAIYHYIVQYGICARYNELETRQAVRITMHYLWRNFTPDQRRAYIDLSNRLSGHNRRNEGLLHSRRVRRGGGNAVRVDGVEGVGRI
ncbi:12120_t:CDS:2 [Acaulospora colombiana]|uniref:12120_t:CDS:1 n=1 Tax=Acaulospora colombiana TaxID=27376 RepID=A0ACA9JYR3_9GLOM|nr:12120_t:CDS:2 [Acaulospora colombiana]